MKSCSPLPQADRERIVELLFPDLKELPTLDELEKRYPERNLPAGAIVSRVAPSPTGYAHLGLIYMSIFNYRMAKQTGGVFIVRIEDTDTQREKQGAKDLIARAIYRHKIAAHEGLISDDTGAVFQRGEYGPYVQSERKAIFRAACVHLVRNGLAYPCFATAAELDETVELQKAQKLRPGYYGAFAKWRDASLADIEAQVRAGVPAVIRFRSFGSPDRRVVWQDGAKGETSFPEYDIDPVILKSDGQSLYHLAHMVDDHFMRVTDVVRGEEWLSSVPLHLQLFEAFGWKTPRYTHLAHMMKQVVTQEVDPESGKTIEKVSKRKLSKRHDPDADVAYFRQLGYPPDTIVEYLLNILNSAFEDWRKANPDKSNEEFQLTYDKLSPSGALSDLVKVASVSKEVIAKFSAEEVFNSSLTWAKEFDAELAKLLEANKEFSIRCLGIERGGPKPNKRIANWGEIKDQIGYMFDGVFEKIQHFEFPENVAKADCSAVIKGFLQSFAITDSKDTWFAKCKELAASLGFAADMKEYKKNPAGFKGSISDVTTILRVATTGRRQTPDLWEIMQVLGDKVVRGRLNRSFLGD